MSGSTFDANIVIDALTGYEPALIEIRRVASSGSRPWISRIVWIEVLSKGPDASVQRARDFLSGFAIDDLDGEIAERAALLRRERLRLRSPDAIILATAIVRGRTLITRNTKGFPSTMPGIHIPYTL